MPGKWPLDDSKAVWHALCHVQLQADGELPGGVVGDDLLRRLVGLPRQRTLLLRLACDGSVTCQHWVQRARRRCALTQSAEAELWMVALATTR